MWCGESFVGTPWGEGLFLLEGKGIKYKNKRLARSCLVVCLVPWLGQLPLSHPTKEAFGGFDGVHSGL